MSVEIQMHVSCVQFLVACLIATSLMACSGSGDQCLTQIVETKDTNASYLPVMTTAGKRIGAEDFTGLPANWCRLEAPGAAIDILLLSDPLAPGSILSFDPVAAIGIDSADTRKYIVVAVPTNETLKSVNISSFEDLLTEYEPVRNILQTWIVNYKGFGTLKLTGWQDERFAAQLIEQSIQE